MSTHSEQQRLLETEKHSDKTLKDGLLHVKSKMTGRKSQGGSNMEIQLETTSSGGAGGNLSGTASNESIYTDDP